MVSLVEFKANVNDPKEGRAYQATVTGHHANSLIGKKIGEQIDGIFVGLPGYKLLIVGGSDKDGFPMRKDLPGPKRMKILVSQGLGFKPKRKGSRKRKSMRGNAISPDIVQINLKIVSHGVKSVSDLLKPAEKKEES